MIAAASKRRRSTTNFIPIMHGQLASAFSGVFVSAGFASSAFFSAGLSSTGGIEAGTSKSNRPP
jgi:hypothetical protein